MSRLALTAALILTIVQSTSGADCSFDAEYGYTELSLDASINYKAYHKVDGTTFRLILTADSDNWLGFGFGEPTSGHMKGGDFVTVRWTASDTTCNAEDRYADFASIVQSQSGSVSYPSLTATLDEHHDWTVVEARKEPNKQVVHLTRLLDTGDQQDRVIGSGELKILWAHGSGASVAYHGANRGSIAATIIGTAPSLPTNDGFWDYSVDSYSIPTDRTTYACQSFELPTDATRHVVAIEPLVHAAAQAHVHHMVVHICDSGGVNFINHHSVPRVCDGSTFGDRRNYCYSLMWSWAVGMGTFILPADAGFKVGSGGTQYLLMEVHYDNPSNVAGVVDQSGFRMYYTNTLRANDAGTLWIGDPTVNAMQPLPGITNDIHRQATCPSGCTTEFQSDITIFGIFQHMHYFGKKMVSNKYDSSGAFVRTISRIDFWDNGFQQTTTLDPPVSLARGESIQTHCVFDNSANAATISFGAGTDNEMCMEFLFYYPVQTRGMSSANEPAPLEMCGARDLNDSIVSICGSPNVASSQAGGPGWVLSGSPQVDRSSVDLSDPLNFGTANLSTLAAFNVAECDATLSTATYAFTSTNQTCAAGTTALNLASAGTGDCPAGTTAAAGSTSCAAASCVAGTDFIGGGACCNDNKGVNSAPSMSPAAASATALVLLVWAGTASSGG